MNPVTITTNPSIKWELGIRESPSPISRVLYLDTGPDTKWEVISFFIEVEAFCVNDILYFPVKKYRAEEHILDPVALDLVELTKNYISSNLIKIIKHMSKRKRLGGGKIAEVGADTTQFYKYKKSYMWKEETEYTRHLCLSMGVLANIRVEEK